MAIGHLTASVSGWSQPPHTHERKVIPTAGSSPLQAGVTRRIVSKPAAAVTNYPHLSKI